ncbi:MAG TPA: zf-HC2 domain-containing protein [Thermoanaerobaculia bacterium]|nr:zf-HC2 domain-containing protein [Thermoanaerobaculia bacterium]
MPHVDDPTLHALLDGALPATEPARAEAVEAHLEGCADCRARLAAAAGLRERAGAILATLAPEALPGPAAPLAPDFEEVRRRAAARGGGPGAPRRPESSRPLRWAPVLAWAATLVVALGIGYLIGDQVVPAAGLQEAELQATAEPEGPRAAEAETTQEEAEAAEADSAPAADAVAPVEQQRSPAPLEAGRGASTGVAGGTGTRTGAADPVALPRPSEPVGGEALRRTRAAREAREAPPAVRPQRQEAAAAGGAAAPLSIPAAVIPGSTVTVDSTPDSEPKATAPAPAPAPPRSAEANATGLDPRQGEPAVPVEPSVARRSPARPVVVTGQAAAPDGWRAVSRDEATRLLGGPLYALPGARVLGVFLDPSADPVRVRSRQRLPDGDLLELTQRPVLADDLAEAVVIAPRRRAGERAERLQAEAAPGPPPMAADETARRSATVVLDGFELTVEGDLPPEALRTLVRNAVPVTAPGGEASPP